MMRAPSVGFYPLGWSAPSPGVVLFLSSSSPVFVSVDWGTSAFRARLAAADGSALDAVEAEVGATGLASRRARSVSRDADRRLDAAFPRPADRHERNGRLAPGLGRGALCRLPRRRGGDRRARLTTVPATRIGRVVVVPGLSARDARGAPDVMRGEETQILGALGASGRADGLFVLPGTHSKWARVEAGRIVDFATFMTGEVFAALKDHSLLGRLMAPPDDRRRLRRRRLRARPRRGCGARAAGRSAARDLHDPHARPVP